MLKKLKNKKISNNQLIKNICDKFFKKGFSVVIDGMNGTNIFRVYKIGNQITGPEVVYFIDIDLMENWLSKQ